MFIMMKQKENINEKMGFNPDIPQELVDYVYKQYLKTCFVNNGDKFETSFDVRTGNVAGLPDFLTFVVERGKTDDYYDAAVFGDGTIHLNVDALSKKSPERAKSSITHEITHVIQHIKTASKERLQGEYGYNQAKNNKILDTKERRASDWMIENLQENEIEARLTQIYNYVKETMKDIPLHMGNASEAVAETVEAMEDVTKLNDLQKAIDDVKKDLDINYAYDIKPFVKNAVASLYGKKMNDNLPFKEVKKIAERLLDIYRMRYDRYKRKVYNTVWQGMQDAQY